MAVLGTLVVASLATATPNGLSADQRLRILEEAQTAYAEGVDLAATDGPRAIGSFKEAARRYEQLATDGVRNGFLYYDLGNAYLQARDIGSAILWYRRAGRLVPGDPRLEHNLATARSLCRDR